MNELMTHEEREFTLPLAESFLKNVNDDLRDIKHRFFRIGFYLSEANDNKYYEALGYKNITDLAEKEFQLGSSSTYDLINIYKGFHDWKTPMQIDAAYEEYSQTQLRELSRAKYAINFSKIVKPTDTVDDVKEFVKALNKYYNSWRWRSTFKSIDEVFETFDIKRKKELKAPTPAPEPQSGLIEISERAEEPHEDFPTQVENIAEAEETDEEFEAELAADYEEQEEPEELPESNCYTGEDYSQYSNEFTHAENITDDEVIKYALKIGPNFKNGKFRIYDKFNEPATKAEFVDYVKREYGQGGSRNKDWKYIYEKSTTKEGMTITCLTGKQIDLPWPYVAGRISRLIESGEYLSVEEHARYTQWKAEQDGLVVNVAAPAKPKPEKPKITNWEFLETRCTCQKDLAAMVVEGVNSIPKDFGVGMPDRLEQWLMIWFNKPLNEV